MISSPFDVVGVSSSLFLSSFSESISELVMSVPSPLFDAKTLVRLLKERLVKGNNDVSEMLGRENVGLI